MPNEVHFYADFGLTCTDNLPIGIPFRRGYLLHGVPGRYAFTFWNRVEHKANYAMLPVARRP